MATKTTAPRPKPRSSQSHSHSHSHSYANSQSQKTFSRTSTTPSSPSSHRIPHSVGQALPPSSAALLRSPALQKEGRTPSPNYFGLIVDPASDPRGSAAGPKDNWSSSSSIVSFAGAPRDHIPLDANPEFELFRRQSEGAKGFNLGHGNLSHFASTPGSQMRPASERRHTRPETQDGISPKSRLSGHGNETPSRIDQSGTHSAASANKESRGQSIPTPSFFDIPRQQSPAQISQGDSSTKRDELSYLDDRHPRLSMPQNKANPPSPRLLPQQKGTQHRAETLPSALEESPTMLPPSKLQEILEQLPESEYLLLDLRVSPQYAAARIKNALNLCIPTTLLKRPSFNLEKLCETFTNEADKARFMKWKDVKYIIVYDAQSTEKKDAISSANTLKKFLNHGWNGTSYILRGGFVEMSKTSPHLIDAHEVQDKQASKISLTLGTAPDVAPVAGGCVMPATKNAANPFFSNIRQNTDLIGGVGQMDLVFPAALTGAPLPTWLAKAVSKEDHGKRVSDKFLRLELAEQARMQKALSSNVSYGTPAADTKRVQIAGIEKGGKNRYNNIWPFEHARVKLQNKPDGSCDYINASHIKSSRSNKRYIASQGPLPATFNDFWSVVWDEDVRVIVMLTAEKEGGQLKCHPYWESQQYGPLKLNKLSEKKMWLDPSRHRSDKAKDRGDTGRRRANTTAETAAPPTELDTPYAIVRKFTLTHSGHPFAQLRELTQVHYASWPDFGAPASADQVLNLVEVANAMQHRRQSSTSPSEEPELNQSPRPMLVHCSAGCGRTGTFCTIDSVIDMMKRQRKEVSSGITPMEGMSSGEGDYIGKGKKRTAAVDGDWIFNMDVDLVEKTVEDFRGERLSMVQSLRQYVLCYEAVLEWMARQTSPSRKGSQERRGSDGHATMERRRS